VTDKVGLSKPNVASSAGDGSEIVMLPVPSAQTRVAQAEAAHTRAQTTNRDFRI
jgi:hypothetical protein